MENKCSELWDDLVSSMVQNKVSHSTKKSGKWLHSGHHQHPAAAKEEKRRKRGKWQDDVEALCDFKGFKLMSLMSFKCSNPVLFCIFFWNRHQLNSPGQCPRRRPCWRRLLRRDRRGKPQQHSHTRTGEAPEDETVVIRLRIHTRCEEMSERSTGSGRYYLSATAAAMGTRILPRAVAASSSISVFNRLMTHSMASRPWERQRKSV